MSRRSKQPRAAVSTLHPDVMETVNIVAEIMLRQRRRQQQGSRDVAPPV